MVPIQAFTHALDGKWLKCPMPQEQGDFTIDLSKGKGRGGEGGNGGGRGGPDHHGRRHAPQSTRTQLPRRLTRWRRTGELSSTGRRGAHEIRPELSSTLRNGCRKDKLQISKRLLTKWRRSTRGCPACCGQKRPHECNLTRLTLFQRLRLSRINYLRNQRACAQFQPEWLATKLLSLRPDGLSPFIHCGAIHTSKNLIRMFPKQIEEEKLRPNAIGMAQCRGKIGDNSG